MKKLKYNGLLVDVYQYEKDKQTIEQVIHPGGVCVAAITPNNTLLFVKQYRFGVDKPLLEFPAGLIEPNEDPKVTALRELEEETGYLANHIESLGSYYLSPGYSSEIIHLYFAKDLKKTSQNLDLFEEIEIIEMDLNRAFAHNFKDIKTELLLQKVKELM